MLMLCKLLSGSIGRDGANICAPRAADRDCLAQKLGAGGLVMTGRHSVKYDSTPGIDIIGNHHSDI